MSNRILSLIMFVLLWAVAAAYAPVGGYRIYSEAVTMGWDGEATVTLLMDNSEAVKRAFQIEITAPEGYCFVTSEGRYAVPVGAMGAIDEYYESSTRELRLLFTAQAAVSGGCGRPIASLRIKRDETPAAVPSLISYTGMVFVDESDGNGYNGVDAEAAVTSFDMTKLDAYAVLDGGVLTFYSDGSRASRAGRTYDILRAYSSANLPEWASDAGNIAKVVFDKSFEGVEPSSTAFWFYQCAVLTEIEGLEHLKTAQTTSMSHMFAGCTSLAKIPVGDFLTGSVIDMSHMFAGCSVAKEIDVRCFETGRVADMTSMFADCKSVETLDVSGFDVGRVTSMREMFAGCGSLKTIYSERNWHSSSRTSVDMFKSCVSLTGGLGTRHDDAHVSDEYARLDGGSGAPGYFTGFNTEELASGLQPYAVLNSGKLTFYYDDKSSSRMGIKYAVADRVSMPTWYGSRSSITAAEFDSTFVDYTPRSTYGWFYDCPRLQRVEGMEYLNTSEVVNMYGMFRFCYELSKLDVTHFDTGKVTDMACLFCYCTSLTELDVKGFVTDNVIDMQHMFHTCPVSKLDLKNFNTSKVRLMNTMFAECHQLKTIYVTDSWTTANVSDGGGYMFGGCHQLVGGLGTAYSSGRDGVAYAHIDGGLANPGYLTDRPGDPEPYAVVADGVLTFYYDGFSRGRQGNVYMIDEVKPNNRPGWCGSNVLKAEFDSTFIDYRPLTTHRWFDGCTKLTAIEKIENLNTEKVTDMRYMFLNCRSIVSVDVSGFITHNVKDMSGMFADCRQLSTLELSNFDTGAVEEMSSMFSDCRKLASIYLSSFDTSKVKSMSYMFSGCQSLKELNLSDFDTSSVQAMSHMFYECSGLEMLDVHSFDTSSVTNMEYMFMSCSSLQNLDVSQFDTSKCERFNMMFCLCGALKSLDVSHFDTSSATSMVAMFSGCGNLGVIDVSGFDTSSVTDMTGMFNGCTVKELDVSHFDTSRVRSMGSMFGGCNQLENLDVSHFDTSNVVEMGSMFDNCASLRNLDVSSFTTSQVTMMNSMFNGCNSLQTLDVSGFKTEKVKNFSKMFRGCRSIPSLDVSGFVTANATYMDDMFLGCVLLKSLDVSGFETGKVISMRGMFEACSNIKSLDLSNFDTSNVTDMSIMFSSDTELQTIVVSGKWTTAKLGIEGKGGLFYNCFSLVGGKGTVFSSEHIDASYACIDGGLNSPGYFTAANPMDVNGDKAVDVGDVNAVLGDILGGGKTAAYDVNGDGRVDVGDVNAILAAILAK